MNRKYAVFSYGESRSGKTTYYTPVVLRDDLEPPESEHGPQRMIQSFLFLPDEENPEGELNKPYGVHAKRVHDDMTLVPWDRWEGSHVLRRQLEEEGVLPQRT